MRAVIVAPGPSLEGVQIPELPGVLKIAVTSAVKALPDADILYSHDLAWWDENPELWWGFSGLMFGGTRAAKAYAPVHELKTIFGRGVSGESRVVTGSSGHIAIQLGLKLADDLALLGFDCKGEKHAPYGKWLRQHRDLQHDAELLGKHITNCTTGTAIDAYPCGDLLKWLRS